MAPKKQKLSPDAKQPGVAAAFSKPARSSGEGGGLCEPLSLFVRTCASPEFDDYSVNHIFSESGAKVSSDESERAEDGAGNGVAGFCLRCAALTATYAELLFVEALHETLLAQPRHVAPQCVRWR